MSEIKTPRPKRKTTFILILFIVGLALFSLFLAYKLINRNGRKFYPSINIPQRNVAYFCQFDEDWAEDSLGSSKYKMSDSGCLVSCIAAAIQMQGYGEATPGELNKLFSDNACYDKEGNLQWEKAEKVLGLRVTKKMSAEISSKELDRLLANGIYPIARVNLPYGVEHFVLITGSQNGGYICMDPLNESGEPVELSYFGNKIFFVRYLTDIP